MTYYHIVISAINPHYVDLPPIKFEAVARLEDQDYNKILHFIDEKSKQCIEKGYKICGRSTRKLPINNFKAGLEYVLIEKEDGL